MKKDTSKSEQDIKQEFFQAMKDLKFEGFISQARSGSAFLFKRNFMGKVSFRSQEMV